MKTIKNYGYKKYEERLINKTDRKKVSSTKRELEKRKRRM
jgi:hypothetical protein